MPKFKTIGSLVSSVIFITLLSACGSGGGSSSSTPDTSISGDDSANTDTLQSATVTGTLQEETNVASFLLNMLSVGQVYADIPTMLYLDDDSRKVMLDANNQFSISDIEDGDHSLFWEDGETRYEFEFRMTERRGLDFGTITIKDGTVERFTGFNGYHFGFVDEDGDGVNDNFADADGDGICDTGSRYAGYAYMHEYGFSDADGDGINDRFVDADGDGVNDRTNRRYGQGFGFVDDDNDGINDRFRDQDGDGICDINGIAFSHGFGFVDADNDGINDRFIDTDGDGINDINGEDYIAMPGWVDLDNDGVNDYFSDEDGDGINDRFVDADNDGINDLAPLGFAHGFGFVDEDGDGVNDRFVDADGDGINDYADGAYANMAYRYGFQGKHQDSDGDGITDDGRAYRQCFGWVDSNNDGINDVFTDVEGAGLNDVTNYSYVDGFVMGPGGSSSPMWSDGESGWPRGSMRGGGGMMR